MKKLGKQMKQTRTPQQPKPYAPKIQKQKTKTLKFKSNKKEKYKLKWIDNEM
jgi:hypothetical protein